MFPLSKQTCGEISAAFVCTLALRNPIPLKIGDGLFPAVGGGGVRMEEPSYCLTCKNISNYGLLETLQINASEISPLELFRTKETYVVCSSSSWTALTPQSRFYSIK
jgi:hypothetical protein